MMSQGMKSRTYPHRPLSAGDSAGAEDREGGEPHRAFAEG